MNADSIRHCWTRLHTGPSFSAFCDAYSMTRLDADSRLSSRHLFRHLLVDKLIVQTATFSLFSAPCKSNPSNESRRSWHPRPDINLIFIRRQRFSVDSTQRWYSREAFPVDYQNFGDAIESSRQSLKATIEDESSSQSSFLANNNTYSSSRSYNSSFIPQ